MTLFPRNQPRQVLRIKRLLMAMASYAMWIVLGLAAYRAGLLPVSEITVVFMISGVILSNFFFFVLIRFGINRRFKDPSLTFFQCIVGICWALFNRRENGAPMRLLLTSHCRLRAASRRSDPTWPPFQ